MQKIAFLKALLHGAIFHATCLAMFKKDFDNALQEVLHAAMIFMQLATIGDRATEACEETRERRYLAPNFN